jgi:hypothetical protein
MTAPILYLDYDGVLHAADVRVTKDAPLQPQVYVRGEPTDQPLFRYMALLELLLAPYPELRIVLSTSWVRAFGYEFAVKQLSPTLRERVIGATTFQAPTRFDSIDIDAQGRGLTRWLALDDDLCGWPEKLRHLIVAPTNPVLALAQPGVAAEMAKMLDALCAGRPLQLESRVTMVPPTMDRLLALPGITEAEIIDALEEDARVEEILRQTHARPPFPSATPESIEAGERLMAEFRKASAAAMVARIESKELISGDELALRLGINEEALSAARESGQLFFLCSPTGARFYPSFFADDRYDPSALSGISQALRELPGASKYYFFTTKSHTLGTTPLEALAEGRLAMVLDLAVGFYER